MLLLCAIFLIAAVIDPTTIPEVLRRGARWVLWRSISKPDNPKARKVPFLSLKLRKKALVIPVSHSDPSTWRPFDDVYGDYLREPRRFSGIMRAFVKSDGIVGIDADGAYPNADYSSVAPWAKEIEERFADTFRERSVSRTGFHVFALGQAPRSIKYEFRNADAEKVEVYDDHRFFVVTSDLVPGAPLTLTDHQADIESLVSALAGMREQERQREEWPRNPNGTRAQKIPWKGSLPQLEVQLLARHNVSAPVRHPGRHDMLLRMLGSMHYRGVPAEVAEVALQEINQHYCDPPYPPNHITAMVRSAQRWSR